MGTELAGKTLAVIGCGRIGQQVRRRHAAPWMGRLPAWLID